MTSDLAIAADKLRKRYGDTTVLDGLTLRVPRASVFALLGPNGAGKTTTVRLLSTLTAPDGGRATVAGHDVVADVPAVRRAISLTGQYAALDELQTGAENLRMIARLAGLSSGAARARTTELLERFELTDAGGRRVGTYSGGMRRRLDLGASLVGAPRVLLLDEPTTGLDPRSRIELWDAIRRLVKQGTDVLLTTQYLEEADQLAQRIVIIDHGRAIAAGSPAELKRRIGGGVIEVHVAPGQDLGAAANALARVNGAEVQINEEVRRVSVGADGGDDLMRALEAIGASGIEVDDIALRQPNLDEVFLALTGTTQTSNAA
jgi:ABC-2 type transport system ATP-binding protein